MAAVRGAGFSSAVLEDIYFDRLRENLDQAEELGVDFVELPHLRDGPHRWRPGAANADAPAARRPQGAVCRIHRAWPYRPQFNASPEIAARHLTVAKAAMKVAADIGASHLVLHTGRTTAQADAEIEDLYARQREAFASLGDIAARHSIIIAVENIFPTVAGEHTALPSRLAREIETINHPNVRGCLDFSHAALTCAGAGVDFLPTRRNWRASQATSTSTTSFGDPAEFWTFSGPSGSLTAWATCTCPSAGATFPGLPSWGTHVPAGRDLQPGTSRSVLVCARKQYLGGARDDQRLPAAAHGSVGGSAVGGDRIFFFFFFFFFFFLKFFDEISRAVRMMMPACFALCSGST